MEKSPDFRGIFIDGANSEEMSRSAKGGLDMTFFAALRMTIKEFVISTGA